MADSGQNAPEPPAPHWRHEWYEYEGYRAAHLSHMRELERRALVLRDGITFFEVRDDTGGLIAVNVRGRIGCAYDVTVAVDKWLEAQRRSDGRYVVRGEFYTYQAWRVSDPALELVRYDSSPNERLHIHRFAPDGHETDKHEIGLADLPNLDQFIEYACELGHLYGTAAP